MKDIKRFGGAVMNAKIGFLAGALVLSFCLRSAQACPASGTPAQMAQCAANTKAFDDQAAASAKTLNDQAAQAVGRLAAAQVQAAVSGQPMDPQLQAQAAQAMAAAKAANDTAARVHANNVAAQADYKQYQSDAAAQQTKDEQSVAAVHAAAVAQAAAQPVAIDGKTNLPVHIQADGNLHYADGTVANNGWWPSNAGPKGNQMTLAAPGGAQIAYTQSTGILPQPGAGTIDANGNQVITGTIGGAPYTMVVSKDGSVTVNGSALVVQTFPDMSNWVQTQSSTLAPPPSGGDAKSVRKDASAPPSGNIPLGNGASNPAANAAGVSSSGRAPGFQMGAGTSVKAADPYSGFFLAGHQFSRRRAGIVANDAASPLSCLCGTAHNETKCYYYTGSSISSGGLAGSCFYPNGLNFQPRWKWFPPDETHSKPIFACDGENTIRDAQDGCGSNGGIWLNPQR